MSKRNFVLLIIVLVIATLIGLGFLYSRLNVPQQGEGIDTEDTNFIARFNPFGNRGGGGESTTQPVDVSGYDPNSENISQKLRQISSMPVAGYGIFERERVKDFLPVTGSEGEELEEETEFAPLVRYVERATGNIYQTFLDNVIESRVSTTIIPKIYDAYLGNNGESVIMRYLQADNTTIETFIGAMSEEEVTENDDPTPEDEVVGTFLPENIKDISVSPDNSKVFYLFLSGDGIVGTTLDLETDRKVQVFDSPFTEWLSSWSNRNMITLTTKPSSREEGHMYAVNPNNSNFSYIFGGINGLTTLTGPTGELVLYNDANLSLYIYDVSTKNTSPLGIRTLPEKCVWNKIGTHIYCAVPRSISLEEYPDTWYQGETSFEDQFWKIDVGSKNATLLLDPATEINNVSIDGIKLALDIDESYLLFVNKKDSFLWKLELE